MVHWPRSPQPRQPPSPRRKPRSTLGAWLARLRIAHKVPGSSVPCFMHMHQCISLSPYHPTCLSDHAPLSPYHPASEITEPSSATSNSDHTLAGRSSSCCSSPSVLHATTGGRHGIACHATCMCPSYRRQASTGQATTRLVSPSPPSCRGPRQCHATLALPGCRPPWPGAPRSPASAWTAACAPRRPP